ncbi:MAG: sensor histidine kinase, partial [Gammaproteobacteria bacterium]
MKNDNFLGLTRNNLLLAGPERLISFGRLVTVVFAILAIYVDPTQPAKFRTEVQFILALYASATVLLIMFPIRKPIDSKVHFIIHALDTA